MADAHQRPRSAGVVYASVLLTFLVLIATIALSTRQPPPPSIAEFAPQSIDNITDAPTDQTSSSGRGAGRGGDGGPAVDATPTPPPAVPVARVRRCVGDPPRQIEDPQSPPCVPFWAGENGGATTKGVTRDQITIGMTGAGDEGESLLAFFNQRFEFYGRRLVKYPLKTFSGGDETAARAAGVDADDQGKIFATGHVNQGAYLYLELARRRVISATQQTLYTEPDMQRARPYLWSYTMGLDRQWSGIGEWMCFRLAGRPAAHAGNSDAESMATRTRKFGLAITKTAGVNEVSPAPLHQALARCSSSIKVITLERSDSTAAYQTAMLNMKNDGVTTVLCMCAEGPLGQLQQASTSQAYYPEWLVSTYVNNDFEATLKTTSPEHLVRTFGITFNPRQTRLDDHPSRWAEVEGDPSSVRVNGQGGNASNTGDISTFDKLYHTILLIASGVQLAGPNLTPETFERGLQRAAFPNPDHRIMAGRVGFGGGMDGPTDYSMTQDAAEFWWSTQEPGPVSGSPGTFCYVDAGARRTSGTWPVGGDPFFVGDCDSGG